MSEMNEADKTFWRIGVVMTVGSIIINNLAPIIMFGLMVYYSVNTRRK